MIANLPDHHDLSHLVAAVALCPQRRAAFDGGAHRGIWTRAMCDQFDRVVAVEPTERADRIDPRATVTRAALGAEPGQCGIAEGAQNTGQAHVVTGYSVPLITVDSLGLTGLDLLKLDVEGYELFALRGARETLERERPVVVIEENGLCERYGVRAGEAGRFLASLGAVMHRRINKDEIWIWK